MLKSYNQQGNSPAYIHPFLRSIYGELQRVKDVWEGKTAWYKVRNYYNSTSRSLDFTSRVTNLKDNLKQEFKDIDYVKAQEYLPQEPSEPNDAYLMRLKRSVFDRKFREFIAGDLAGLLSNYSVTKESRSLSMYIDNVDTQGNSLDVFLGNLDCLAARDGMVAVLTEMPKQNSFRSNAEAIAANNRPYWVTIERCDLTFIKTKIVASQKVLTMAGIRRDVEVPDGKYGVQIQTRYRILELIEEGDPYVTYVEYAETQDNENNSFFEEVESGAIELDYIPLTLYSLTSLDPFYADIALYDYAELNIEQYRLYSEIREALHASNNPTPVINDRDGFASNYDTANEVYVFGPNTVLRNVDVDKLEFEGKGIEQTMTLLERTEKAMDAKGVSFISSNHILKTATEVDLNASQSESRLAILARNKESAFQEMARYWSDYMDESEWAEIQVDKDLIANLSKLSPGELLDAMATGSLSRAFTLPVLNQNKAFGEVLPEEAIAKELQRSGEVDLTEDEEVLG